jgi:hypothetical protein
MNKTMKKRGLIVGLLIVGITVLAFLNSENPLLLFESTFKAARR